VKELEKARWHDISRAKLSCTNLMVTIDSGPVYHRSGEERDPGKATPGSLKSSEKWRNSEGTGESAVTRHLKSEVIMHESRKS